MQKPSIAVGLPLLMLGTSDQKVTKEISLIISQKGNIHYTDSGGGQQQIQAGALVSNDGSLQIEQDSHAVLYSNGHYLSITEAGTHELSTLIPSSGMRKLNYDARFGLYLMAAVDMVVHAGDDDAWGKLSGSKGGGDGWGKLSGSKGGGDGWGKLSGSKGGGDGYGKLSGSKGGGDGYGKLSGSKGGGDGYGKLSGSKGGGDGYGKLSGSKGGGDGWGDLEGRIVPILPFGKIPDGPVIFQWSEPKISKAYILEILDEAGSIVHSTQASENWAQLNLSSLPLRKEATYTWRIAVPEQSDLSSTKVRISITAVEGKDIIKKKLQSSDAYKLENPVLCGLMEAVVLEDQDHFYEAHQRYEMLRQTFKQNELVKLMQAAFYVRHQLKPRAQLLFR